MNLTLSSYRDKILSVKNGNNKGIESVSKPLFILSIMEAIEYCFLTTNQIEISNAFIRKRFGQLYELYYHNDKGYASSFFIRPYYHLGSSDFYHLVWKEKDHPLLGRSTPSEKYLRDNLLYAKVDDELWELLQDAESREFIRRNIITRFPTKQ